MAYLGSWKIDDALTFPANTHRFDTGAATDADAVPSYRVYEDETATAILTGNMALLDSGNTAGFYSEQITLSAANGFEKGKCYTIYISATVNSVEGTMSHTFQMEAEVDANTVSPGVTLANGAITDASLAGNMEIVFETDFATNYNTTRNAWVTNQQDTVGTGNLTADVIAISGDSEAADRFEEAASSVITGTVDGSSPTPSTTAFGFTGTNGHTASTTDDFYNGKVVTFVTGNLAGQSTDVTDFTGTDNILTVTALTAAPDSGSVFTLT